MFKRMSAALLLVALLFTLTACAQHGPVTVFADDVITVTRQGHSTAITDVLTGETYTFTTRHVRRAQDATEATQRAVMQTATDTDTLKILTASNIIIVVEKSSLNHICLKIA